MFIMDIVMEYVNTYVGFNDQTIHSGKMRTKRGHLQAENPKKFS